MTCLGAVMSSMIDSISGRVQIAPSLALQRDGPAADLMTGKNHPTNDFRIRYGFKIAGVGLLVNADTVAEVVPRPSPVRIPRTPSWFSGLSNLRGTLVPMFDLELLMGFSDRPDGKEDFALIVGQGDEAMGFFIAQYPTGLDDLDLVADQPPLPEMLMPFVGQAYFASDSIYVELNYPRFFSSLTKKLVA